MRIGLYGGSFNPPHVGHAMVAAWLRWTDRVDQVWLLPTFKHPFDKELRPFTDRVRLCEALAGSLGDWVRVETIEERLPMPSYTVDTLDVLTAQNPGHRFHLVVGADVLDQTDKWKSWDRIVEQYSPIIVGRQGYPTPNGAIDFPGVSSTEIRRRMAAGEPVDHLVPAKVLELLRA